MIEINSSWKVAGLGILLNVVIFLVDFFIQRKKYQTKYFFDTLQADVKARYQFAIHDSKESAYLAAVFIFLLVPYSLIIKSIFSMIRKYFV